MHVHMSIHMSIHMFMQLPIHMSVNVSIHVSMPMSIHSSTIEYGGPSVKYTPCHDDPKRLALYCYPKTWVMILRGGLPSSIAGIRPQKQNWPKMATSNLKKLVTHYFGTAAMPSSYQYHTVERHLRSKCNVLEYDTAVLL